MIENNLKNPSMGTLPQLACSQNFSLLSDTKLLKGKQMKKNSKELQESIEVVSAPWKDSPYYAEAEQRLHLFWGQNTVFSDYLKS